MAKEDKLVRVLRVLDFICARRRGATVRELCDGLDFSRASVRRYVQVLIDAELPIEHVQHGNDVRVRFVGDDSRKSMPSTAEVFALASARQLLQSLKGTQAVAWLDQRLQRRSLAVSVESGVAFAAEHAQRIEQALTEQRRLRIDYWGARDVAAKTRIVEPLELRFAQRAWYLTVRDVELDELRTLKLTRVQRVEVLPEHITTVQAGSDTQTQVGVWDSQDKYDVVIRIFPPHARFAHEYPLTPTQTLEAEGDTVVVRARVNGLYEVTRWVLRFGGDAHVEAPAVLVEGVAHELRTALARYRPPDPF